MAVAEGGSGVGRRALESEAHCVLDRAMKGGARSSLFATLFGFDSKMHPSTAAITETFQSSDDRSRI